MAKKFTYNPINIENSAANDILIKIQGVIGFPEWWQFEDEADKVSTKEKMRDEIEKIANIKSKRITVQIDSFGGDVNHAIAIYNALRSTGATITTEYTGWSASAATIIGMAGEKRIIPDNGFLLIHQAQGGQWGTAESFQTYADWLKSVNNVIADIYSNIGGADKDEIVNQMNVDGGMGEWISAERAKELGLVTEITSVFSAVAYTKEAIKEYNLPVNNLKFDKMENPIKEGILNLLGVKNDAALSAENTTLTARVAELEAVVAAHPEAIEAVQNQLNASIEKVSELESAVVIAENAITERDAKIEELIAQVESLQNQLSAKPINTAGAEPNPIQTNVPESELQKQVKKLLATKKN